MVQSKNDIEKQIKKKCFLITPIGPDGSLIRKRVDQWIDLIYKPALGDLYDIFRADQISSPGVITEQIVQHIIDADLVMIDYTGLNPNVMYEAAIRHLTEKPYIQLFEEGAFLPFDIHNLRSFPYNPSDLEYPKKLVNTIKLALEEIEMPGYEFPKIAKEKFDFNKIISDPERFVQILKEYIVLPAISRKGGEQDSIVTINEGFSLVATGFMRKKVICPNCKTIKFESPYSHSNVHFSGYGGEYYRCNVCGTEFEF